MMKVNPDRSRRYIARTTPDKITGYFWPSDGPSELAKYEQWAERFRKRMELKHKRKHLAITAYMSDTYNAQLLARMDLEVDMRALMIENNTSRKRI